MAGPPLEQKVEAILFFKAAPIKLVTLCKTLDISVDELQTACQTLNSRLQEGATRLLLTDTEISLVVAPELTTTIEEIRKDDLKRDIGKAGAETLAIVLYRGPIARGEIDRIRGVNSAYILRNLQVRGLIERGSNSKRIEYQITPALLQHLGITQKKELPQYEQILNTLDAFEASKEAEAAAS